MLEIWLFDFFAEHKWAFNAMDQPVNSLKNMSKDDPVIQNVNMVRTKATAITKYVVGQTQEANSRYFRKKLDSANW